MIEKDLKINRTFVKDEVYELLLKKIITGELAPCQRLRIQELSEKFGISRTPLREALLQLENEKLVLTKANRWTIVAPIDPVEALNIYPIIYSLESLALELAYEKIGEKEIEKLKSINNEIEELHEKKDQLNIIKKDNEFHNYIITLSGNTEIEDILSNLKKRVERMELYFYEHSDEHFTTYDQHLKIINALEDKNLDDAKKALTSNWTYTLDIVKSVSNEVDLSQEPIDTKN